LKEILQAGRDKYQKSFNTSPKVGSQKKSDTKEGKLKMLGPF